MINYITAPFKWFFKLEAASGLLLLIFAIIALFISDSNLYDINKLQNYVISNLNNWWKKNHLIN